MKINNVVINKRNTSFCSLLTLLFITLRLTGYINWSWWWVLSPLWIGPALVLGFVGIGILILVGSAIIWGIIEGIRS